MSQQRLKVAYFLTPITFGGAEKVSLNFLRGVDRDQFDIHPVLLTRPWEDKPYFARCLEDMGFSYKTLPVARKINEGPFRVIRVASRFHSILSGNGSFDLVHTHGYFANICGLPVARLLGIRSMATCHGFIENDRALKVYNRLDIFALQLCKTIIAVSPEIGTQLVHKGIPSASVVVIPNSVGPPPVKDKPKAWKEGESMIEGIEPGECVVGYIGRLSKEKGVVYLLEAIGMLRDAGVPARLVIVGDGPERVELEQRIKAGGLENNVIITGFQPDTATWLSIFDIFILPSLTEGTPMALIEAMAAGVPVVATAVGGVPRVLTDSVNGLLIPPANPMAIVEKLKLLIGNPGLRREMAKAGEETVKHSYGFDKWCRSIERIYSENQLSRLESDA